MVQAGGLATSDPCQIFLLQKLSYRSSNFPPSYHDLIFSARFCQSEVCLVGAKASGLTKLTMIQHCFAIYIIHYPTGKHVGDLRESTANYE